MMRCSVLFKLLLFLWNVDRVKRDIDAFSSDDTEDDVSGSGSGEDEIPCCTRGNYCILSIHLLMHLIMSLVLPLSTC